jgi:hypothetical protein
MLATGGSAIMSIVVIQRVLTFPLTQVLPICWTFVWLRGNDVF